MNHMRTAAIGALWLALSLSAHGQDYKADFLREIDGLEKKFVSLAEAIPADKYSWRPAPGVRSISEVFMHVSGANYMLPGMMGVKPPEGISRDMEKKVTDKAEVVASLKKAFAHIRQGGSGVTEQDLSKNLKVFGRDMPEGSFLGFMVSHLHEHLGQSIAYARVNGVKPPWSGE
jgi:uncharacterized damage-inducible protein DinB